MSNTAVEVHAPRHFAPEEMVRWFPQNAYYAEHAARFAYSLSNLPPLPRGFRCLSIGSWGAEAPYLFEELGASEVVCIRSPGDGIPDFEEISIGPGNSRIGLYAVNIESSDLPSELRGFDLVLMWEVLEHLCVEPARLICEAMKSLKPGGYASCTTPNALWHVFATAYLEGKNPLGLKLQHHIPFATHWRLYTGYEVGELFSHMGGEVIRNTSFLHDQPRTLKSRILRWLLSAFRRRGGSRTNSFGQHLDVLARKVSEPQLYRPEWLHPSTTDTSEEQGTQS